MTDNEKTGCDWKILAKKWIPAFCFFASMAIMLSIGFINDHSIKGKSQIFYFLISIGVAFISFMYITAVKVADFIDYFDKNEIGWKIRDFVNKLFEK